VCGYIKIPFIILFILYVSGVDKSYNLHNLLFTKRRHFVYSWCSC